MPVALLSSPGAPTASVRPLALSDMALPKPSPNPGFGDLTTLRNDQVPAPSLLIQIDRASGFCAGHETG